MKVRIELKKPFSDVVGEKQLDVEFEGNGLKDLLDELMSRYPGLRSELLGTDGKLAQHLIVLVNGAPVTDSGMETVLKDGDDVIFLIPISGG